MKIYSPEISWHNRDPVLCVDIYQTDSSQVKVVSSGWDRHVIVWKVTIEAQPANRVNIEPLADLNRHQRAVNVVRFAPDGNFIASGDDEGMVFIWKLTEKEALPKKVTIFEENEFVNLENWIQYKILRGHHEDVMDLCWSPSGQYLLSGSMDNDAIVWDVLKGQKLANLTGHNGYVQGVAWDPLDNYLVTLSTDRTLRFFNSQTKKIMNRVNKGNVMLDDKIKTTKLFYDGTLRSFSRRMCFTPGGELLIAPSGIVELEQEDEENFKFINASHAFLRSSLNKFPYRIVFAIATQDSVLFYDTQQMVPFAMVSNISYTRLSDIAWSSNGQMLLVSSTDGYCTFILFNENELGEPYKGEIYKFEPPVDVTMTPSEKRSSQEEKTPEALKVKKTPDTVKITSFFPKLEKIDTPPKTPKRPISPVKGIKRKEIVDLTVESPLKKRHNDND